MQGRGVTNYSTSKPTHELTTATTEFDDALLERGIINFEQVFYYYSIFVLHVPMSADVWVFSTSTLLTIIIIIIDPLSSCLFKTTTTTRL